MKWGLTGCLPCHISASFNFVFSSLYFPEVNECINANAKHCGECIQAGAKCGWCKDPVHELKQSQNTNLLITFLVIDILKNNGKQNHNSKSFPCLSSYIFNGRDRDASEGNVSGMQFPCL